MNKPKMSVVDEVKYGVYVWMLPDGSYFSDGDGNVLSIAAEKGDIRRIENLQKFAKIYGQPDGTPLFLSGHRKITEAEYQEQMYRMMNDQIADQYDIGAYADEARRLRQYGR